MTPFAKWVIGPMAEPRPRFRVRAEPVFTNLIGTTAAIARNMHNRRSFSFQEKFDRGITMRYRVCSGPPGSDALSPLEKERLLFEEFDSLDGALAWARHLNASGRVVLSIDGDDGTSLSKQEIVAALRHPESAASRNAS